MNGVLVLYKDKDVTSRDVVNKLNKLLKTKKIGHTGTLDPIATGVLIVTVGKCTKLSDILTSNYKEYLATIKLGVKTDTLDITGEILEEREAPILTREEIEKTLESFLGKSIQETPIYSAVKINGKKLYEYAREGKSIELPKREIDIKSIELMSYRNDEIVFRTTVSKGTYIRALINDICTKLNTIGTMSDLVRTKQGNYTLQDTYTIEEVESGEYRLLTPEEVLEDIETIDIPKEQLNLVKNGAIIDKTFQNDIACLRYKDKIIAIYKTYAKDNSKAKPYIML